MVYLTTLRLSVFAPLLGSHERSAFSTVLNYNLEINAGESCILLHVFVNYSY